MDLHDEFSLPAFSVGLLTRISEAQDLSRWVLANQPSVVKATTRSRIAGAYFCMAMDHHAAVLLLLEHRSISAAFSLTRSIWEAYWRGLWCMHIADEVSLEKLYLAELVLGADRTLNQLQKKLKPSHADRIRDLRKRQADLHSLAHVGALQLQNWITKDSVEASHSEADIVTLIRVCNYIAFMAAVEMTQLADCDLKEHSDKMQVLSANGTI